MLALNLYTTPFNNGGIVLYMDADLGDLEDQENYLRIQLFQLKTNLEINEHIHE